MRNNIQKFTYFILITALFGAVSLVNAQKPYRVSDSQVQYLMNRIEQRTDTYKRSIDNALDRSRLNNTDSEDMVMSYIDDFENATDVLKRNFQAKSSVAGDVEDVLNRAAFLNNFMAQNKLNAAAQTQWRYLRNDLNTLARYYNITWNWTSAVPKTGTNTRTTAKAYRVSDANVGTLLSRIESRTDTYRRVLNNAIDRSRLNGTESEDLILKYISEFENSTDSLKQRFDAKESVASDVENVLSRAVFIDGFMRDNNLAVAAERQWNYLKADLNTLANYYNVSWNWNQTIKIIPDTRSAANTYNVSARQVESLLANIETKTDSYKRDLNFALDRSVLNNTRSEDSIMNYVTEFENATDRLRQNFDARRSTSTDVEDVMNRAYYIDRFMRDYRLAASAERSWQMVRNDLNMLANYYSVSWNWDTRQYDPPTKFDEMITGTYRLNQNQSDNVAQVVDRASSNFPSTTRVNSRNNLERRLQSPEMLAIQKTGNEVIVASSLSPQITFEADGRARTERTPNGRQINVKADTYYDGVAISYEGDRVNDFYINMMPINNGRQLRVIRRVYLENSNETVTVASVYDKSDERANWSMVTNRNNNNAGNNTRFVVANGTRLTASLTTPLSTKTAQDGDRFRMEVTSPSEYDGAVIEGRIIESKSSGRVSGRANLAIDFQTITLRNGQSYNFAGIVETVKTADGDEVSVNNEGTIRDDSQTKETVTRAGIGAALGALIGAITGGGQGAAIGAAIGAGVGGGSVILTGRDNIELNQGAEFVITATGPNNNNQNNDRNYQFNFNR